jgi:signal transduction histidine kinase
MDITRPKPTPPEVKLKLPPDKPQNVQQLANIINLLPCYIFVSNVDDQTISLINLKLAKSLGLSNSDVAQGKKISEYFTTSYTRQIIWQQQQVLTNGEEIHVQEEVTLSDGVHYFDTMITPLRDDSQQIYALLHTSNDIPDLAATKEALSQRTLQLEAANKELESFSYSVSHDLQAPLRIINGFSQVLWNNYLPHLDDRGKHYLQRIQANSERMSDLIDALLQLSRVTRTQMKSVPVNLSKIARDIIEELQAANPDRTVEFMINENLTAIGDPQLLRIVLNNLLNNAWKYTSKRYQGKIEFNTIASKGDKLTFLVRDNGAGFDLEYADKLFTAFKRLHTQAEFPGTGIGLATVQRIIYRHGGKVWAEGECDRGATIYFTLEAF